LFQTCGYAYPHCCAFWYAVGLLLQACGQPELFWPAPGCSTSSGEFEAWSVTDHAAFFLVFGAIMTPPALWKVCKGGGHHVYQKSSWLIDCMQFLLLFGSCQSGCLLFSASPSLLRLWRAIPRHSSICAAPFSAVPFNGECGRLPRSSAALCTQALAVGSEAASRR